MADLDLEILIGRVLRIGVTASSVCLAAGLAASLLSAGAAGWLLTAGLVILILTPAAHVVLSIVEYAAARDWRFVLLTTIVLLELVSGAVAAIFFDKRL